MSEVIAQPLRGDTVVALWEDNGPPGWTLYGNGLWWRIWMGDEPWPIPVPFTIAEPLTSL